MAQRAIGLEVEVLHGTPDDPRMGPACGTARGLRDQARRLAATSPADVIHLHELFRPPHLQLAALLRRTPYVVSTHGATAPRNLARYRVRKAAYSFTVERLVAGRADALVALTPRERDDLLAWMPAGPPIRVIPNVADAALIDGAAWSPPSGPAPIVTLARWDVRHKGLDRLARLAGSLDGIPFVVHGSHCGNEPDRLAALRADAPPNLELAPPVHGEALAATLRSARAFALLSRWEGLSMAVLEALATGVPCLVSPEVATTLGDDAPVVIVPSEARDAAATVRALLDDPDRQQELGSAGRRWVRERAAAPVVAAATADLYAAAVRGNIGRSAGSTVGAGQ